MAGQDILEACRRSENSTDCLLAALVDAVTAQGNQFNWDPASFIVTLAIGVIALVFAGVTIFQALLSAGPGRLKSSRHAIGRWAQYNQRRFSREEMRWRTIASTPVITLKYLDDLESKTEHTPIPASTRFRVRHNPVEEGASWLRFLQSFDLVGVDGLEEPRTQTVADSLPSELQAVPGHFQIECVLLLAAMAGATKLAVDVESKYPLISGPGFQIRFSNYPTLGTAAVFQSWDQFRLPDPPQGMLPKPTEPTGGSTTPFKHTWLIAHGFLRHGTVGASYRPWNLDILINKWSKGFRDILNHHEIYAASWSKEAAKHILDSQGLPWLLFEGVPPSDPLLFPFRASGAGDVLDTIVFQSGFWASRKTSLEMTNLFQNYRYPGDAFRWWAMIKGSLTRNGPNDLLMRLMRPLILQELAHVDSVLQARPDKKHTIFSLAIIAGLVKALAGFVDSSDAAIIMDNTATTLGDRFPWDAFSTTIPRKTVRTVRLLVSLTSTLRHDIPADVPTEELFPAPALALFAAVGGERTRTDGAWANECLGLLKYAGIVLGSLLKRLENYPDVDLFQLYEEDGKQKLTDFLGAESGEPCTIDLLVYRAYLMAALFRCAVDNSDFFDSDVLDQVVPMI